MNKNICIVLSFALFTLLDVKIAFANPIGVSPFNLFSWQLPVIISLLCMEVFAGYFFFFKRNNDVFLPLVVVNLVSYPIFYILNEITHTLSVFQGELLVVVIEAFLLKFFLGGQVSLKKSFAVSFTLNAISYLLSVGWVVLYYLYIAQY